MGDVPTRDLRVQFRRSPDGLALSIRGPLTLSGALDVPGDKSISHRALLFAAIADGTSSLANLGRGTDVEATRRLISALGAEIQAGPDHYESVIGRGFNGLAQPATTIDCGNSGTTMRLGAGVLAGRPFFAVLNGDVSLRRRPMSRVVLPLREMGAKVNGAGRDRFAPLVVRGGNLHGIAHCAEVASAQVKGALVLAGLQANGETLVELPGPTRDHTERILAELGCDIVAEGHSVRVRQSQPTPFELRIPGDVSSASFLIAAAAVCPGSEVLLRSVSMNPSRFAAIEAMQEMGVAIDLGVRARELGEDYADVRVRYSPDLRAIERTGPGAAMLIDEIPILACLAALADGTSVFRDLEELRSKESDRIEVLRSQLTKLGVEVEAFRDGLAVTGGGLQAGVVNSCGDHRIAMAFASVLGGLQGESVIEDFGASEVSYPDFGFDLGGLAGIKRTTLRRTLKLKRTTDD